MSNNIVPIGLKNMHEKLSEADIIIARGGFNTISECLVLKNLHFSLMKKIIQK